MMMSDWYKWHEPIAGSDKIIYNTLIYQKHDKDQTMKVLGIKLATGEEIFGDCEAVEGRLKITNPVQIRMVPSQIQGAEPQMAFVPFPHMADDNFTTMYIEPLHIVYQFVPHSDLVQEYTNLLSGKQTTPAKQIITG
jgi:hypothetical protein